MSFFMFLKEKVYSLILMVILNLLIMFILQVSKVNTSFSLLIVSLITAFSIFNILIEYFRKNSYIKKLITTLDRLDKKYYIQSFIEKPNFLEGKILFDIIENITISMNDYLHNYNNIQYQYKNYIETWIHEIKSPISSINLICDNNKNNNDYLNIKNELIKIDNYIEQVLYYSRSKNVSNDYFITKLNLHDIVNSSLKNMSNNLINNNCKINIENLDYTVYSDAKWLLFILNQIISNSIKYKSDNLELTFLSENTKYYIEFSIIDNGTPINDCDINRLFDMGFTGTNGRNVAKSTGMGLYICKTLCDKMHMSISIQNNNIGGVTVKLLFPKDTTIFNNVLKD